METRVRFFKQDGKWYADIPNRTLEENEMVLGADIALEQFSEGKDEVFMTLTDTDPGWNAPLVLTRKEHDDEGATYRLSGVMMVNFIEGMANNEYGLTKPEIWICNVTHDVFGEHPEKIYLLKVE